MDYLEIKSVAKAVKEMCSSRGLNVSGIEWAAKLNENDDPVCVEASFRINGNHDVSEQADGINDLSLSGNCPARTGVSTKSFSVNGATGQPNLPD
jgi:hypothetical protein